VIPTTTFIVPSQLGYLLHVACEQSFNRDKPDSVIVRQIIGGQDPHCPGLYSPAPTLEPWLLSPPPPSLAFLSQPRHASTLRLRGSLQNSARRRRSAENQKSLFNHINRVSQAGSSKESASTEVTATLPAPSQPRCRCGCPSCLALHFTEGPTRLKIHEVLRLNRSQAPESRLALAWGDSVVYGPLQRNHIDSKQYWLLPSLT